MSMVQWKEKLGYKLRTPASRVSSASIPQHGHNKSLPPMETQFSYQSTQMTESDTSTLSPAPDKISLSKAGSIPTKLQDELTGGDAAFISSLGTCLSCAYVFSLKLSTLQGQMPQSLSLQKGETLLPLKVH